MNVIITMAGLGTRFRSAGYSTPKYQVTVGGRTLFSWSLESLRNFLCLDHHWVFVARQADNATDFIRSELKRLVGFRLSASIIELEDMTDGQATTVLRAEPALLDTRRPILVYNIDTFVNPECLKPEAIRGDGWIPCFPGAGDAWSFVLVDNRGRATEVQEKVRISDHASIGLYWFSSYELYRHAYVGYYSDPAHLERGERYVAPLYNQLIREGVEVYIHEIPVEAVFPLGTPADVASFISKA